MFYELFACTHQCSFQNVHAMFPQRWYGHDMAAMFFETSKFSYLIILKILLFCQLGDFKIHPFVWTRVHTLIFCIAIPFKIKSILLHFFTIERKWKLTISYRIYFKWIFQYASPLAHLGSFLLTFSPTSCTEKFSYPRTRAEAIFFDWLKFTRACIKPLSYYLGYPI